MKKAFTLIELLVVIAIIAILAAILFPVFAQAKLAAKKTGDLNNMKQIGLSTKIYLTDYDDTFYPHRFNCGGSEANGYSAVQVCNEYLDANGNLSKFAPDYAGGMSSPINQRVYYVYLLQPYTKNYNLFDNKGASSTNFYPGSGTSVMFGNNNGAKNGPNYGGQNSYGHNDFYLSPGANTNGGNANLPSPPSETAVPRVASTVILVDSRYYGAGPDVTTNNESGLQVLQNLNGNEAAYVAAQNSSYLHYWMNIGNANWTQSGSGTVITPAQALKLGPTLYSGKLNVQFVDGHAHSTAYNKLVGDICMWTTDADGEHPRCSG